VTPKAVKTLTTSVAAKHARAKSEVGTRDAMVPSSTTWVMTTPLASNTPKKVTKRAR